MLKRFTPVLVMVALCWLVFWANYLVWHGQLNQYGIIPRRMGSLPGILWAPFLHASLKHLTANTVPLLFLGGIICLRGKGEFGVVATLGVLLGGVLTWLFGRTAIHIGASGLVFCCFGYIASLAWFQRTFGSLVLSVVCLIAYGGLLRGVLPTSLPISWEGHLAGLLAGIAIASASPKGGRRGKLKSSAS